VGGDGPASRCEWRHADVAVEAFESAPTPSERAAAHVGRWLHARYIDIWQRKRPEQFAAAQVFGAQEARPVLASEDEQPMIVDHGNVEGTNLTLPAVERSGEEGGRLWHSLRVVFVLSGLLVVADQHEVCPVRRHAYGAVRALDRSRCDRRDRDELLCEWRHVGHEWIGNGVDQEP